MKENLRLISKPLMTDWNLLEQDLREDLLHLGYIEQNADFYFFLNQNTPYGGVSVTGPKKDLENPHSLKDLSINRIATESSDLSHFEDYLSQLDHNHVLRVTRKLNPVLEIKLQVLSLE